VAECPHTAAGRRSASSPKTPTEITQLLLDWTQGDETALEELLPLVFEELRRQASGYLRRERSGHTLQPTALVNEVYLRLIDQKRVRWKNRAHFFGVAAQLMRRILVDHARARHADKRGGPGEELPLDEALDTPIETDVDLLALDDALAALSQLDSRQARVVELRFFAGMTIEETAEVLGVTHATVERDWRSAKAYLAHAIRQR
jgi:RNA polymerase sigma factor (TIGR02999 family)